MSVKDVVSKNETRGRVPEEMSSNQESLCKAARRRLGGIVEIDSPLLSVSKKAAKQGQVLWSGDNQNFPYSRQHQCGERIVNHRLVINREKLFRHSQCHWVKPCAAAAGQDDTFAMVG